ncbi:hypothetical protein DIPPA_05932 [Diplonema papillatum]|nr:hypothetical protein DIPPA_05932 [Diplonema papillatum]
MDYGTAAPRPARAPHKLTTPVPSDALYWTDHPKMHGLATESPAGGMFHSHGRLRPTDAPSRARWFMLFMLSLGSALNQVLCFSFAPFANRASERYGANVVAQSEAIFFLVYIPMSFIGSYVVDKFGLRTGIIVASVAQATGAWVRYSSRWGDPDTERFTMYVGQTIASLGMCVFVNTPPRLSTAWFPQHERTLSTNIAVNANAAGAAMAYLLGPFVVKTVDDFPLYNLAIAFLCSFSLCLVFGFFESHPRWKTPDTVEMYDWSQWTAVLQKKGFKTTLIVFAVSECVINMMSTLLATLIRPNDFSSHTAGMFGAEFLIVCMLGGILFGTIRHKWHLHQNLAKCMVVCAFAMLGLRFVLVHPTDSFYSVEIGVAIFIAGLFLGPLQPTCNELGVECAFPASESTVAALQQLFGNLVSAIAVPFMSYVHKRYAIHEGPIGVRGHISSWAHWWAMPEVVIAIALLCAAVLLFRYDGAYCRLTMEYEMRKWDADDGDAEEGPVDMTTTAGNGASSPENIPLLGNAAKSKAALDKQRSVRHAQHLQGAHAGGRR